jgi:hypothetical protein
LVAVAALVTASSLAAPAAIARDSTKPVRLHPHASRAHPHVVHFTASFTDPGTAITGVDTAHCRAGVCGIAFAGTAHFQAPLAATDRYVGYLFPVAQALGAPADGFGEGWDTQTGSLDGCGAGSFVMHQTHLEPAPSPNGIFRLTFDWDVEDGTGAFAGATGHGTAYADFTMPSSPAFPPTGPNNGVYTGTITCPRGD